MAHRDRGSALIRLSLMPTAQNAAISYRAEFSSQIAPRREDKNVESRIIIGSLYSIGHELRNYGFTDCLILSEDISSAEEQELRNITPTGKIISIAQHNLGPVWTVLEALKKEDFIEDDKPVIINYCDFGWWWNYFIYAKLCNYFCKR